MLPTSRTRYSSLRRRGAREERMEPQTARTCKEQLSSISEIENAVRVSIECKYNSSCTLM